MVKAYCRRCNKPIKVYTCKRCGGESSARDGHYDCTQFGDSLRKQEENSCCEKCKLLKGWIEHLACPCHTPKVATSEKMIVSSGDGEDLEYELCDYKEDGEHPPYPCENCKKVTPHESEDWKPIVKKWLEKEKLENYVDTYGGEDFDSVCLDGNNFDLEELAKEAYQRGREEGIGMENVWQREKEDDDLIKDTKDRLIRFAVQEIEKERRQLDARMDSDAFARDISFNSGLDKAKSIISGLMKK